MRAHKDDSEQNGGTSLKGTFISVMAIGIFIIVSWAVVYGIYLFR
ncbi:cytochrome c oxidase subunit 2A [Virgibacillus sp. 179-BFC.A HS]|uniref:Cytochrome c oxidase subunit 2A n=1 Tax=Tigheibacillus jepli TaxID=3035914 RepID=A0ABU5CHF2_9BACI|nr:cytochrome c oxidase subunit 2A [Virgibacillus sp. 179-BFC.A HS]MDY0405735.1 cytochrome c oxidase subunit 2A [Virgibacillus sp. 179-BFC.A HS]